MTLTGEPGGKWPFPIGMGPRSQKDWSYELKSASMSARDPIRPRGAVPAALQSVDLHVSAWPVGPSAPAIAQPDRPRGSVGEIRRLLLVQRFGRRDRPLGQGRGPASISEEDA